MRFGASFCLIDGLEQPAVLILEPQPFGNADQGAAAFGFSLRYVERFAVSIARFGDGPEPAQ